MSTYPKWVWADRAPFGPALRVETAYDSFIDYVRVNGVWRQKTHPMTNKQSVTPERHWIGEWREGSKAWPEADPDMSAWLDATYEQVTS